MQKRSVKKKKKIENVYTYTSLLHLHVSQIRKTVSPFSDFIVKFFVFQVPVYTSYIV